VFVRLDDGGVLPEGDWRASLNSEGVFNSEGEPLDGDGDHLPGGDFRFDFSFIRGDANIDGAVDLTDLGVLAANFGQVNRNFNEGDFNYDNIVDLKDFQLFASRFGGSSNSGGTGIVPSGSGLRQQDPSAAGLISGKDELL
jgi:hypothetical protein